MRLKEEHKLEMKQRISELNSDHENSLKQFEQHESELNDELDYLREKVANLTSKVVEKREHHTQTEYISDSTPPVEEFRKVATTRFQCMTPRKETRSQSMASEHLNICQKVSANKRFQNIMDMEMDMEQGERCNKYSQGGSGSAALMLGSGTTTKAIRESQESWTNSLNRGLLDRRERNSFKLKLDQQTGSLQQDLSPTSPSTLNRGAGYLSPTSLDLSSRRRVSPSRQLFSKEEKRPAWKF